MNHCVPDFEIQMDDEEDYTIPISSGLPRSKKSSMQNDEVMELLWQNGQVVMQRQNQRPLRKPPPQPPSTNDVFPAGSSSAREIRSSEALENFHNQYLFMQEDEMASWLHYSIHDEDPPLDHHNFCADDILCAPPDRNHSNATQATVSTAELRQQSLPSASRPPIPPPRRIQNFANFTKHNMARTEPRTAASSKFAVAREPPVADSCDTPVATAASSRVSEIVRSSGEHAETGRGSMSAAGKAPASSGGRETGTCEMTVTSSPCGSTGSAEPGQKEQAVDRKQKGMEPEESEFLSEVSDNDGGFCVCVCDIPYAMVSAIVR